MRFALQTLAAVSKAADIGEKVTNMFTNIAKQLPVGQKIAVQTETMGK